MSAPSMGRASARPLSRWAALVALIAGCAGPAADVPDYTGLQKWTSRAIPEARGDFQVLPDGKRAAVRYRGWTTRDFNFRTYAYDDPRAEPPIQRVTMPAGVTGDPQKGRALFLNRAKGPCTGCHLIPGDDVWPAGSVGPDQSIIGDRKLPDQYFYQLIWDPRVVFPNTSMPPWGTIGGLSSEEIVHLVAYLQTLKGPVPPEKDPDRNPFTRRRPVGFGDNLDPTNNPAVLLTDGAETLWTARGPMAKACADCHAGGVARAMRGVATRYPKFVKAYRRVMSVEDFLAVHAPETTGRPLPAESTDNLRLTMLVKRASNGLPVNVDTSSIEARAALARGKATFYKRVGERNHACADCHTPEKGANKFLGGRLLGDVTAGLTKHFPLWRTVEADVWGMRKRFQWCMTPLGMNMLASDSIEYAELELYLTTFDNGKPLSVPGMRH
ncbi:MAG: sulfur oxidation c-type cytochrome SoxA [Candidatus Rokuibacteriota bacterium]|nr:MAG: sulfur oxidation c-type cytochrome SoxA [Candidatus Rokubacteria bacterium]